MGCLHPSLNKPPIVIRPLERKKQQNQVLLTELSDLDESHGHFTGYKVPTLVGRKHGSGKIFQKDEITQAERESQRAHVKKRMELRRKQDEQLRKSIEDHKLKFKLRHEDEETFKYNHDKIAGEVARKERFDKIRNGELILAVEEKGVPETGSGFRTGWGPENLVIHDIEGDPEPRPPTYRKADIVPKLSEFQTFDKHAKDAPPRVTDSISSLVNYLKDSADNQFQLVRMFYKWITFNISFDVDDYYKEEGNTESVEADDVLQRKVTTSEGYSNLMAAMCRLKLERAALEWDVKPVTHTQHHIIIVRREVIIELAEVGHKVEDYSIQFKRKDGSRNLDQYYFAYRLNERSLRVHIRPQEEIDYVLKFQGRKSIDASGDAETLVTYILKCAEVEFQLRTFPISYKIYGAVPDFSKYGFCSDLTKCVEYTTNTGEMMLPFKVKRSVRCMCKLEHITEKKDLTNYVFVIGKEHGISIKIRLPFEGYYKFTLFGKQNENGNFRPVATFLFDCYEVTHVHSGFPVAFESAMDLKCSLYKPLWKDLPANSQITIVLGCPRLQKVSVMFTPLKRDDNYIFEGTVTTPPAGQPFIIYGQVEDNSPLLGLYHFTIF